MTKSDRRIGGGFWAGAVLPAAAALVLAAPAAGQVTIDDFGGAQGPLFDPGVSTSAASPGGTILGTERDMRVVRRSGAGTVTGEVTVTSELTFTAPASTAGVLLVDWDGTDGDAAALDTGGLGGADLTAGGHDALTLTADAAGGGTVVHLEVWDMSGNRSVARRVLPAILAPVPLVFAYSDFSGSADFSSVGAVRLRIEGQALSATFSGPFATTLGGGVAIAASKVDALVVDNDADGQADPGDTLEYTVVVASGGAAASGVVITDPVDENLGAVADLSISPLARDDSYTCISNVGIVVPPASGVLINDADLDGGTPTATFYQALSAEGGTVSGAGDGSFTYVPPAGFEGTDFFSYSILDDEGDTDFASVEISCSDPIWFIDDSAAGGGNGTFASPFDTLAGFEAADPDGPGDCIFIQGPGTADYTGGLALEDGQTLIGSGAAGPNLASLCGIAIVPPHTPMLPAPTGVPANRPTIENMGGHAITLASGNTVRGIDVGETAGAGYFGSGFGNLTVREASVGDIGQALDLSNGTLDAVFDTLAATDTGGGNPGIELSSVGGSLTVTTTTLTEGGGVIFGDGINVQSSSGAASFDFGATTVSKTSGAGDGIDLDTSASATFTFDSLSVTTSAGDGLSASSSGTVNIGGTGNTISATGGAALDLDNTLPSNGSGGAMTFSSLSSTNSSGRGIDLTNLPAGSRLTVTGTTTVDNATDGGATTGDININGVGAGSAISFGTTNVSNRNGTGIFLDNVADGSTSITFGATTIPNPNSADGYGVRAETSSAAFTFDSLNVSGTTVTSAQSFVDVLPGVEERFKPSKNGDGDGVFLDSVSGSFTVSGGSFLDIADNAFDVFNSSDVVISGVTIDDGSDGDAFSTLNTAIQVTDSSGITVRDTTIKKFGNELAAATTIRENAITFRDVSGQAVIRRTVVDTGSGFVFERFAQLPENIGLEIDNRNVDLEVEVSGSTFQNLDFQGIQARHLSGDLSLIVDGGGADGANTFMKINGAAIDFGQTAADAGGSVGNLFLFDNDLTDVGIGARAGMLETATMNLTIIDNVVTRTFSDGLRIRGFGGASPSTLNAHVTGNLFDDVGLAVSTVAGPGQLGAGNGLEMLLESRTTSKVLYSGNTVDDVIDNGGSIGINVANTKASVMDLVFTGNVVRGITSNGSGPEPLTDFQLIGVGTSAAAADPSTTCLALSGNNMTPTSPVGFGPGAEADFFFDIGVNGAGSTLTLEDYPGPTGPDCFAASSVEPFVKATNTTDQTCAAGELFTPTTADPAPGGANLCVRPPKASSIAATGSTTASTPATLSVTIAPAIANIPVRFSATAGGGGQSALFPEGQIAYTNASGVATLPIQSNGTAGAYTVSAATVPAAGGPVVFNVTNP